MLVTGSFLKKCSDIVRVLIDLSVSFNGRARFSSFRLVQNSTARSYIRSCGRSVHRCNSAREKSLEAWGVLCSVVYPSRSRRVFLLPAVWRGGGSGGKARPPVKGEFMLLHWRLFCCLQCRNWFYIWSLELSRCVQTGLKREPITALVISIIMFV